MALLFAIAINRLKRTGIQSIEVLATVVAPVTG